MIELHLGVQCSQHGAKVGQSAWSQSWAVSMEPKLGIDGDLQLIGFDGYGSFQELKGRDFVLRQVFYVLGAGAEWTCSSFDCTGCSFHITQISINTDLG
jgi:hypothetical protein